MIFRNGLIAICFSCWATSVTGQAIRVTDDVCSETWLSNGVWRYGLAATESELLFARDIESIGCELSRITSDGNLVSYDLFSGPDGSHPGAFRTAGDRIFFGRWVEKNEGREYGMTEFSAGRQISVEPRGTNPLQMFNDAFLFREEHVHSSSLWAHNGDTRYFVAPISSNIIEYDGNIYFSSYFEGYGSELAVYDGQSVERVANLQPGRQSSWPSDFAIANGKLYFVLKGISTGNQLWSYDGVELNQIGRFRADSFWVDNITEFNGLTYFTAPARENGIGNELWVTNGLEGSYDLVADIFPGWMSSNPSPLPGRIPSRDSFIEFNEHLWFYAYTEADNGATQWLYKTDGDTVQLATDDLKVWSESDFLPLIVGKLDDALYYWSESESAGIWLYENDGQRIRRILHEDAVLLDDNGQRDFVGFSRSLQHAVAFNGSHYFLAPNDQLNDLWQIPPWPTKGCDVDGDGYCDVADVDALQTALRQQQTAASFDTNGDDQVSNEDLAFLIHNLHNTYFGDANLDGEFNSQDLVRIFTAGEYEDDIAGNSLWLDGDWNGDGEFNSSDLVLAFQDGGYEQGPKPQQTQFVPEPTLGGLLWMIPGLVWLVRKSIQ